MKIVNELFLPCFFNYESYILFLKENKEIFMGRLALDYKNENVSHKARKGHKEERINLKEVNIYQNCLNMY
jgi:hypothetical protein